MRRTASTGPALVGQPDRLRIRKQPGGQHPTDEGRTGGRCDGKKDDTRRQSDLVEAREHRASPPHQDARKAASKPDTGAAAQENDDRDLAEQLQGQAKARRAKGGPYAELSPARRQGRQQQIGDIGAGDEQQQGDGRQ